MCWRNRFTRRLGLLLGVTLFVSSGYAWIQINGRDLGVFGTLDCIWSAVPLRSAWNRMAHSTSAMAATSRRFAIPSKPSTTSQLQMPPSSRDLP